MISCYIFAVLLHFGILGVFSNPLVPCYFIFGDSLVDSGNNNELVTTAKANYKPYGIDFPGGRVTGRFTNGLTMADQIGKLLEFDEFIPTYASATEQDISTGVNYASGGSGILCETGSHLGDRICLERQLNNHNETVSRLSRLHQNTTFTTEHLSKCLYIVNIGSNDYVNNFLRPSIYNSSHKYSPDQYASILVQQYSQHLKRLYTLGGRKIVVFGLAQIGCTPIEIKDFGTNGKPCVDSINDAVKLFNDKLKPLIHEINHDNQDAKFTFINVTHISSLQRVLPWASLPCCKMKVDGQCVPTTTTCPLRVLSIYYDGLHPSQIAHDVIALSSYFARSPLDASPYDISQLVRL